MKRIPVTQKGAIVWALVDDKDYKELSLYSWYFSKGHARTAITIRESRTQKHIMMHRLILKLGPGDVDKRKVDHINRDRLDNRRKNLRVVTSGQNQQNLGVYTNNKSGYRGVWYNKHNLTKPWSAQGQLNYKRYHLGNYATPEEADEIVRAWRRENMPYSVT